MSYTASCKSRLKISLGVLRTKMNRQSSKSSNSLCLLRTALLFGFLLVFSSIAGSQEGNRMDEFSKCLTEKKAMMYGSFWCLHCDDQKKLFGSSFKYVSYVECSLPGSRELTFPCRSAQIHHTPTWIFADGDRREGTQTLQQLSSKTGCILP